MNAGRTYFVLQESRGARAEHGDSSTEHEGTTTQDWRGRESFPQAAGGTQNDYYSKHVWSRWDQIGSTCYRCGIRGHSINKCRVSREVICHNCGKPGHLRRACKSKHNRTPQRAGKCKPRTVCRVQDEEEEPESDGSTLLHVKSHGTANSPPIQVKIKVDDCLVNMHGGRHRRLGVSESTFRGLWPRRDLTSTQVRLQSYSKEPIPVVGCCNVNVEYNGQTADVPLLIVQGSGPTLLGRDWLSQIRLDWKQIHRVHTLSLQAVLNRHPAVAEEGLGTLKGFKAKIYVDPTAQPKFHRARSVPYALRDKVEKELQRLQEEGTLEPVDMAEWAAHIVPALKCDKSSVRICGDFRVTVNPVSKLDKYPIPKVEDLFASLRKGKHFTKLDLSQAYQQLPLDDDSKKYVVINTHRGLFRYTRLPFGISSAPGIFQRVIESLLQGVEGVVVYLDDILITGSTEDEHLRALEEVLDRLDKAGLRVKQSKCEFMRPSVDYLGHRIDATGLHPLQDKVRAIKEAPTPKSVHELKSYLGILTYYGKFLPNLSSTLHSLYQLLKKDTPWSWGAAQAKAFEVSKKLLTSAKFLAHFDSNQKLTLACDASGYGLGAVLAHKMPDGSEKPIGYASRTLTKSEKTTLNWRKRDCRAFSVSRSFTITCSVVPSNLLQPTSHCLAYSRKTTPPLHKHPHGSSAGPCSSRVMNTHWYSETLLLILMLMR